jgi:hypothetical protein
MSACVSRRQPQLLPGQPASAYVSMCQHMSAYVSRRQRQDTYLSGGTPPDTRPHSTVCQHVSACVSIRQQTSASGHVRKRRYATRYKTAFDSCFTSTKVLALLVQKYLAKSISAANEHAELRNKAPLDILVPNSKIF